MPGIDYSEGTWAFARASEYAPILLARLGVPTSEVTKDLIIFVTELLVVISLAAEHGAKWSGFIVASLIDNGNSKEAITSRRSSNRYVRYLLLVLIALEFRFKFRLVAYFAGTKANWLLEREIKQKAGPFGAAALQGSGDRGRKERGPPQR